MRILAIVVATMLVAGCETVTSAPPAEMLTKIASGQSSALIVNTDDTLQCDSTIMGLYRKGDEKAQVITTVRDAGYSTSGPAILTVAPGLYKISGASCMRGGYYPMSYPNLGRWFDYVEIGENEVVYIGSVISKKLDFETVSAFDSELKRFWLAAANDTKSSYLVYEMAERPDVRERISALYPDIAKRMVYRQVKNRISNETMAAILKEAFAPGPDGVLPTQPVAMEKFSRLLAERDLSGSPAQ